MKPWMLKGLAAGLLCWTQAAPAQSSDAELQKPLNMDPKLEDGLRRAGIVTGQVLLTSACLASIAVAISGRGEVANPFMLCELLSTAGDRLEALKDGSRPKPKLEKKPDCPTGRCPRPGPQPVVLRRPQPSADPPPAPGYHSASTTGPLF